MELRKQNKALLKALRGLTQEAESAVASEARVGDEDACEFASTRLCSMSWYKTNCPTLCADGTPTEAPKRNDLLASIRNYNRNDPAREQAVGAEPCDDFCEDWEDFYNRKIEKDETTEKICGYYKSERCKACPVVQSKCEGKILCDGNVGNDYNCLQCFDANSGKYLWGSTCLAKEIGKPTYKEGKCGEEYKCFTGGEDIGQCPYNDYCPSV